MFNAERKNMTTKHTCNAGRGPVFGRRVAGCPRCDELTAGAAPVLWAAARKARDTRSLTDAIRAHNCKASRCGFVCTAFDW